ncbi:MAG: hypothetical protein ACKN9D_05430, partial [Actinomycetales bacterium]
PRQCPDLRIARSLGVQCLHPQVAQEGVDVPSGAPIARAPVGAMRATAPDTYVVRLQSRSGVTHFVKLVFTKPRRVATSTTRP